MELNDLQKETYQRAAALCSKSERSPGNIQQKLINWGLNEDESEPVMKRLFDEKFLDEERFARSYVKDKFRFNKWGRIKIIYQLRAEKITSSVIDKALEEIDSDKYQETVLQLLKDKYRHIRAVDQFDRKAKLFRFAQSRGFESDVVYSALDEIMK